MNRVRSAYVKTNSSKACFISLSSDLAEAIGQRIQGQPFAIQLQWQNGKAFTSWSGVVIVEPVVSLLSCNRISVDPVSVNDWEILELHAGYIESQLLHQVRVVFLGQLLPIWIQNQICVVVKIVDLEPKVDCLRLDEFTEVIISPRKRNFSPSKDLQEASFTQENHRGRETILPSEPSHQVNGNNDAQTADSNSRHTSASEHTGHVDISLMSRFSVFVQSLLYGHNEQTSVESCKSLSTSHQENMTGYSSKVSPKLDNDVVKESEFHLCLRVQPEFTIQDIESNRTNTSESSSMICPASQCPMSLYSLQPSAVFVDYSSLPSPVFKLLTGHLDTFPPLNGTVVKTMQMTKLMSPKERASLMRTSNSSPSGDLDMSNHSSPVQEETTEGANDSLMQSIIVTMVMTSREHNILSEQEQEPLILQQAKHVLPGHVRVSRDLCHILDLKELSMVRLQSVSYGSAVIKGIVLHPHEDMRQKNISDDAVVTAFNQWISSVCSEDVPLVLFSGMLISIGTSQGSCPLWLKVIVLSSQDASPSDKLPYYQMTPETLKNVNVVIGTPHNLPRCPDQVSTTPAKHKITDLGGVTDCFKKCLDHVLSSLKQRPLANQLGGNIITGLRSGALLICGSGSGAGIGCGKTALAHAVCYQLQQWPVYAHITVVDCVPFRGKRVETIKKQWHQVFVDAAWHQPAVILFDDLDQIVSAPSGLQEMGGEALYKQRLAQVFKELVATEIKNNSRIAVIATSKSHDSLHPSLLTSRGCHIFRCSVELHPPDASQRKEIMCAMMKTRFSKTDSCDVEFSFLAKKTEGFSPKDLRSLLDRACHKAAVRKMTTSKERGTSLSLITEDFENALEGFTPAALRGVTLHTAGELGWTDVGGLTAVKDALMETLLWPTKYSWLFSKCPLRLRSGLLLYGPPGTGKTLLAGVVAKECGLNFISIKGPELLSKYIGASEQAVRDMFTRAQSAKPCILFFDEFDSLAPRRGHDSTGVTDRVVNQLLTQLDGVEGLGGVYVLAATSRPDLIDPALLRPGRLDKCLYCGIPTKSERLQILQALAKSLTLADDVDLDVIADMCDNFTGADFKALLYNAQLAAIHRSTNSSQLYKGLFSDEDSERSNPEQFRKDAFFIPSLTKGVVHLPDEDQNKLSSEVLALLDNLQPKGEDETVRSDVSKQQAVSGITITQLDLREGTTSMGPSVSDNMTNL
ncbi:Peroxisome biogenesis factor 1 [Acropora cervicornis]|uniref:Peroxisomal ATPase PEX1 n=1 Tax=Acropora cervicornis TaxID=6130 RepID=A0AAD9R636_ACRCE|nr:Peroxisome biogenesis factor 1 [Acropora cervicornis]